MSGAPLPLWVDDRLLPAGSPLPAEGPTGAGCYTAARVERAAPVRTARHVRRLRRDAERLGLEPPSALACERALRELARGAFPQGVGIVRLELRPDGRGGVRLLGTARPLGSEPQLLTAVLADLPHPGPGPALGAKLADRAVLDRAAEGARRAGAHEAILADAAGWVVEGARTNLVVVDASGTLVTPPVARGAVGGLAREIALETLPTLREADVSLQDLRGAREILALNAVRGARPVVQLDGQPVGSGGHGPGARRLQQILAQGD